MARTPAYKLRYYGKRRAGEIRAHLKKELPKAMDRGVDYIKATLSQTHPPASSAGEIPHERTGKLISSIGTQRVSDFQYYILADADIAAHAHYMEFGTKWLSPRPFMRPSIPVVKKIVRDYLRARQVKGFSTVGLG